MTLSSVLLPEPLAPVMAAQAARSSTARSTPRSNRQRSGGTLVVLVDAGRPHRYRHRSLHLDLPRTQHHSARSAAAAATRAARAAASSPDAAGAAAAKPATSSTSEAIRRLGTSSR